MSDLIKLDNIAKRSGDIRFYPVTSNLKRSQTGKDGFGEVVIAVDNETIMRLDEMLGGIYLVSKREWEIENSKEEEK